MTKREKTGGRVKGTPNKRTQFLSDALEGYDFDIPKLLVELYPSLVTDKKLDLLLELVQYLYPKRKALEEGNNDDTANQLLVAILNRAVPSEDRTKRIDDLKAKLLTKGDE